jgi:cupin fold WbuC family metalloprotein
MNKLLFENKKKKDVIYFKNSLIKIKKKDIDLLREYSNNNIDQKSRYCNHKSKNSKLHEMIIFHKKGYYVRPHSHPNKTESVHLIKGKVDIVIFDNKGNISDIIKMGNYQSGDVFYYRMNNELTHTLIIKSSYIIFHETSLGPFKKKNTKFANWSPINKKSGFLNNLKKKIKIYESLQKKK